MKHTHYTLVILTLYKNAWKRLLLTYASVDKIRVVINEFYFYLFLDMNFSK